MRSLLRCGPARRGIRGAPPAAVASVTITPGSFSLAPGGTQQLTATVRDAGGNILIGRTVAWSSNTPAAAGVSSSGLVTAVAAGSATITAECEGVQGTASVTVSAGGTVEPFAADDFEAYTAGTQDHRGLVFPSGFSWAGGPYAEITDEISHSGTKCLKFFFGPTEPGGATHWWSEQRFNLGRVLTEIWLEQYVYFPDGTEGLGSAAYNNSGTASTNNKFTFFWGGEADTVENYDNAAAVLYETWDTDPSTGDGRAILYTRGPSGDIRPSTPIALIGASTRGRWVQWRQHHRLSSSHGVADGVEQVWIDGVLVNNRSDLIIGAHTGYEHALRRGYLFGYDNSRFAQNTWTYVDDVKFYDTDPGW